MRMAVAPHRLVFAAGAAAHIFFGGLVCLSRAQEETERVRVKAVVGTAEVLSPDSTTRRLVRIGMRIPLGWHLRTGSESRVELAFESGTVMSIGEGSVVTLSNQIEKSPVSPSMSIQRKEPL
ncbi:MAG: hypothetical protein GF418_14065 [Chitinivibrionales bacterium]|nr:hypothetical protein [Chitinivibrionales bacterium]MBD3396744.1 hypothetical protein [Chitinivibrionales bacterium]